MTHLRPSRLLFEPARSIYSVDNRYIKRKLTTVYGYIALIILFPYVSVKTFNLLDRLTIWEKRIEKKRREKMAFDWMIKSMAERERDVIEEFSDY
jgi:hypothetical protein